jgi:hypothetical protein
VDNVLEKGQDAFHLLGVGPLHLHLPFLLEAQAVAAGEI